MGATLGGGGVQQEAPKESLLDRKISPSLKLKFSLAALAAGVTGGAAITLSNPYLGSLVMSLTGIISIRGGFSANSRQETLREALQSYKNIFLSSKGLSERDKEHRRDSIASLKNGLGIGFLVSGMIFLFHLEENAAKQQRSDELSKIETLQEIGPNTVVHEVTAAEKAGCNDPRRAGQKYIVSLKDGTEAFVTCPQLAP